jgi:hypothetical protein
MVGTGLTQNRWMEALRFCKEGVQLLQSWETLMQEIDARVILRDFLDLLP